MRAELPSLSRLTDDVVSAMHAAERGGRVQRRGWRRGPLLALTLLALGVPSAVALRPVLSGSDDIQVPSLRGGHGYAKPTGPTVVIARGAAHGYPYEFVAARCGEGRAVSLLTAFALRQAVGVSSRCREPVRPQPRLSATWTWSPGQTWFYGIVRGDIVTVDFSAVPTRRLPDGRRAFDRAKRLQVSTRALDPGAVRSGKLPTDLRLFVVYRPNRSEFRDVSARDATGRVIARCSSACP